MQASAPTEYAGQATVRSSSSSIPLDHATHALCTSDTGATAHMTPHRHWLRNYTPSRIAIRLANNSIVYSEGVGTVVFAPVIGGESARAVEFSRVVHVPDLGWCLLISSLPCISLAAAV